MNYFKISVSNGIKFMVYAKNVAHAQTIIECIHFEPIIKNKSGFYQGPTVKINKKFIRNPYFWLDKNK